MLSRWRETSWNVIVWQINKLSLNLESKCPVCNNGARFSLSIILIPSLSCHLSSLLPPFSSILLLSIYILFQFSNSFLHSFVSVFVWWQKAWSMGRCFVPVEALNGNQCAIQRQEKCKITQIHASDFFLEKKHEREAKVRRLERKKERKKERVTWWRRELSGWTVKGCLITPPPCPHKKLPSLVILLYKLVFSKKAKSVKAQMQTGAGVHC